MARNRMTLLEMVQRTLDAMNHDSVNSISDTIESNQIAEEARTSYYDLMDRGDWPHLMKLLPLTSLVDVTRPNMMQIPEEVVRIDDVRYESTLSTDPNRSFRSINYLETREFLDLTYIRRSDATNIQVVTNTDDVPMFILNDAPPTYWTTFDDAILVFDSFDSGVDTVLQASKSLMHGKQIPTWTESDTFIPDMPDHMFSILMAELTAAAFTYWKQGTSIKDEQRAARGISRLRKNARKINERQNQTNFGRKRFRSVLQSEDGQRGSLRAAI